MSYANDMPSVEKVARTDTGLASALRISVARLQRRLRSERDPDNELLPVGQLSVLGLLNRYGDTTVGEIGIATGCGRSTRRNTMPVSGCAGRRVMTTFLPVCRPTPVALTPPPSGRPCDPPPPSGWTSRLK